MEAQVAKKKSNNRITMRKIEFFIVIALVIIIEGSVIIWVHTNIFSKIGF